MRSVRLTGLIVCVLAARLSGQTVPPAQQTEYEQWYIVSVQGQPAGWAVMREATKDGRITTGTQIQLDLSRAGTPIRIRMSSKFTETADGKPVSASATQMLGAMTTTSTRLRFTDAGIEMLIGEGDAARKQMLPAIEGEWYTPAAGVRYAMQRLEAGDKTITYRTFDPISSMQPMEMTIQVEGPAVIEVAGKTVPATKVRTSTTLVPGLQSEDYIDDEGHSIRTTISMGPIAIVMEAADEQLAKANRSAPELLADTLIHPPTPIAKPRKLRQATYKLHVTGGAIPDLPATAVQSVQRVDERTLRVSVDLDASATKGEDKPELTHSSIADGRDPRIVKLTRQAVKNAGDDPAQRAEAIRQFVHEYINEKSLGVGLATASETARTREGDCSEHAVLLAAMLRADGIPSRSASGLMYVDASVLGLGSDIFGYHMWAQAWLDGRWVDLDAVLPPETTFDATHITLAVSELADTGWVNDLVVLAPLIGQLEIELEK